MRWVINWIIIIGGEKKRSLGSANARLSNQRRGIVRDAGMLLGPTNPTQKGKGKSNGGARQRGVVRPGDWC